MNNSRNERGGAARARLSEFYGLEEQESAKQPKEQIKRKSSLKAGVRMTGSGPSNPLDINSPDFDADLYVNKLVSEASLAQLMAQEGEIVRQIQGLDSDMQTLVYENYNKFIAATETIRKMRVDFRSMEDEMEQLASSMSNITSFSSQISDKLRTRRQEVSRLSSSHTTLQKLQFILELPDKLKQSIADGQPGQAVEYWMRTELALSQYKDMPSFAGIQEDCELIMSDLKTSLQKQLEDPQCEGEQLGKAVELLRQLGSGSEELCDSYLDHCTHNLSVHLEVLELQAALVAGDIDDDTIAVMDPLEFVDEACNKLLSELCLSVTGFNTTFTNPVTGNVEQQDRLENWVVDLITRYLATVKKRLGQEWEEVTLLVRAVDRFHRRLAANSRLIPGLDLATAGLDLVLDVASQFCKATTKHLESQVANSLMDARQAIAQPRRGAEGSLDLSEISTGLLTAVADHVRASIDILQTFLEPELSFSSKSGFRSNFCSSLVIEGVVMSYFRHLVSTCSQFTGGGRNVPPALLLLLSRTCHDLHTNTTDHLTNLLSDQLSIDSRHPPDSLTEINTELSQVSQQLLDSYVQVQAGDLSLMLRKSVEARDWLSTVEPRSVRAVMKRVVEDVGLIDEQVGQLYEEGQRKVRSSDSSRTYGTAGTGHRSRSGFSSFAASSSNLDSSLASNIQKLFSEKIDYFAPVTASKVSVLTGIIKLGLKTLLECVRLKTFGRYGLQQMQVDCHYLQLYLWRFVSDEALVHQLLDEVLGSALHRSLEQPPKLMEPSVVEVICEKGA